MKPGEACLMRDFLGHAAYRGAQFFVLAGCGRQADREGVPSRVDAATFQYAALAANHVAMVRHESRGPWSGCIQPRHVRRRCEHLVVIQFVHHEDPLVADGTSPARASPESRNAEAFW